MTISDFAIKRPIVTVVVMLALVIFGIFALFQIDVDEFPDLSNPIVFVSVPYPGASPSQVEQEVVERMEEAFSGLSGIDEIRSTSLDGFATITVQFVFGKDPDQAAQDVRDAISGIRNDLPTEMKEPVLKKFDPDDFPIVSLVLASDRLSPAEMTLLADPGITRVLRGINGVAQVTVVGGADREISVDIRPNDMAASGVTVSQVFAAVAAQNLASPVGQLQGRLTEQAIRLRGRLETPEDFARLVVGSHNGQLIRLGEVANVRDGTTEQRSLALFNGQLAVGIDITKSKGASTTKVADAIKAAIQKIQPTLPPGVKMSVVRDAGERVRQSVRNVEEALIEGALLTVLVVFVFLNSWRSTVITGLALPVSVLSSFIAVWACGFTLNTMSLLGLSLAIGILIDDAIVVRENIVRHVEMGKDHMEAAHVGTNEITMAVAATTFSIVAVFAPVAFMQGIAGQWFKPFALTIACAVLVSLFVSFSLDPMLSAYWPDPQLEAHERKNVIARALDRFNQWFDRMADRYKGLVAWALDHRLAVLAIVAVSFFGAIALQVFFGGGGFIPDSDRSEITLSIETPPGSNLSYTAIKARELSAIARTHKEVAYTYTSIGSATGSGDVDTGSLYIKMVPKKQRDISQQALAAQLRTETARVAGVTTYLSQQGGPGGNQRQIQVQLRGQNMASLSKAALAIEGEMRKVKGATDIGLSTRGDRPELEVQLNRGLAGSLGLNVSQVAQSMRPAFAGVKAGDWIDPLGKTRDVTVRLAPEARANVADIERLPLVVSGGGSAAAAAQGGAAGCGGSGGRRPDRVRRRRAVADPARPGGDDHQQHRPGADRSPRPRQGGDGGGQRRRALALRGDARPQQAGGEAPPAGRRLPVAGGRGEEPERGLRQDLRRPGPRRADDVPDPGRPVRLVPRPAGDPPLAAAVAGRRRADAADHPRHPQPDEPDRRHPPDGDRGQERHPADRLREVEPRKGDAAARRPDRSRPRPPPPHPDDHRRPHRRHDPRRHGARRRRRLPRPARPRGDRRHHHLDPAHLAGDPDDLRDFGGDAGEGLGVVRAGEEGGGGGHPGSRRGEVLKPTRR